MAKKYALKDFKEITVEVEQVKKDTTIETVNGPALITKGNYIMTQDDGSKVGITQIDLDAQYKPVK